MSSGPHLIHPEGCGNDTFARQLAESGFKFPPEAVLSEKPGSPQEDSSVPIPTIGVFSITGGEAGVRETQSILGCVRNASQKLGKLRLLVFGRHAELREGDLREGLCDLPVGLGVEGILTDHQLVERLRACDVLLFVRGGISTSRGSAIAGIACGVPIVAYVSGETSWPITDAGVVLVSPLDSTQLNDALVRVLTDSALRSDMRLSNSRVYAEHFSWPAIAARFAAILNS